jgi:hypothetical protein
LDGTALYATCTSSAYDNRAQCIRYVQGVLDAGETEGTFAMLQEGAKGFTRTIGGFRWCPPERVTAGQSADIVTKFVRENPAVRDAAAPGLVTEAMYEAWPCRP